MAHRQHHDHDAAASHVSDRPGPSNRRAVWFWVVVSLAAVALRVSLLPLSPRYGDKWDHDDVVRWGIQATDQGVLTLYDQPPPRWDIRVWSDGQWTTTQRKLDRLCNYPPMSCYLFAGAGLVHKAVSEDRLINTMTSRAVFACWGIAADFVLAAGCAALVGCFAAGRAVRWTYLIVLFAPPFWWDSAVWGQADTILLAPVVWMVWAMVRRRWLAAGVLFGLAAMLKPQAVLFLPLWGLAVVTTRPIWRPVLSLAAALVVVLVISLPFTIHSGLAWLHASYVENLVEAYAATTLKAFNPWYIDALLCESLDATARWLGVTKDVWGKAFLLVGLGAGFFWAVRRWRGEPAGLVLWGVLSLLACVMLPTRVHERYILVVLPLAIVAAMVWRRLWPGVALLLVVAIAQVTWLVWLRADPSAWTRYERTETEKYQAAFEQLPPEQRVRAPTLEEYLRPAREEFRRLRAETTTYEWLLVVVALGGALATTVAIVSLRPVPGGPCRATGHWM